MFGAKYALTNCMQSTNTQYKLMCEGIDILRVLTQHPHVTGIVMSNFWASTLLIHARSDVRVEAKDDHTMYVSWDEGQDVQDVMWAHLPTLKFQ